MLWSVLLKYNNNGDNIVNITPSNNIVNNSREGAGGGLKMESLIKNGQTTSLHLPLSHSLTTILASLHVVLSPDHAHLRKDILVNILPQVAQSGDETSLHAPILSPSLPLSLPISLPPSLTYPQSTFMCWPLKKNTVEGRMVMSKYCT